MRIVDATVVVLVIAVCIALLVRLVNRERQRRLWGNAIAEARWEDSHRVNGDSTEVIVRRVARLATGQERELEVQVIETIPTRDVDFHKKFSAARQVAYDRAIDYNNPSLTE